MGNYSSLEKQVKTDSLLHRSTKALPKGRFGVMSARLRRLPGSVAGCGFPAPRRVRRVKWKSLAKDQASRSA